MSTKHFEASAVSSMFTCLCRNATHSLSLVNSALISKLWLFEQNSSHSVVPAHLALPQIPVLSTAEQQDHSEAGFTRVH